MEITNCGLLPELLVLGIPRVDVQHDGIFCRIENLKFLCIESNTLPRPVVEDLLAYLGEHFATEEKIAGTAHVDFAEHAEMHRQTLATLSHWAERVMAEEQDIFSFLRYLEIWFERHIREEDQPFAVSVLLADPAAGLL
jgi:hemerythrin-like metal-binding protein